MHHGCCKRPSPGGMHASAVLVHDGRETAKPLHKAWRAKVVTCGYSRCGQLMAFSRIYKAARPAFEVSFANDVWMWVVGQPAADVEEALRGLDGQRRGRPSRRLSSGQ